MSIAAAVFTGLVALLHGYFLVLECFLWTKPMGLETFRMSPAQAEATAVLAKHLQRLPRGGARVELDG